MAKNKKVETAKIEGNVIDNPIEREKINDKYRAQAIYDGWKRACDWFDANKREEYDFSEAVSASKPYASFSTKTLSQVVSSDTENAIRALVAKDVVAVMIKKPFAKITGVDFKDYPNAKEVDKGIGVIFNKMPNFPVEMIDYVYQRRLYGTAIGKVIYRDINRNVRVAAENDKGEVEVQEKEVLVYSGPMTQTIDVKEDFRIEPGADKLDGYWKYHRFWKLYSELKSDTKSYKNVSVLMKQNVPPNKPQDNNSRAFKEVTPSITEYSPEDRVECVECWSPDDCQVYVLALGAEPVIIKDSNGKCPNPYGRHPFFWSTINRLPKQFYGRGTAMVCRQKQEWLDIVQNCINDVTLQNAAPMFSDPNNEYNGNYIPYEPWTVVHADVRPFLKPQLPAEVYALRESLRQGIEDDSGATRISSAMGTVNKSLANMKANVYLGAKNTENERHLFDLVTLDDMGLVEMVRRCVWLLIHCMEDEVWQQITGKPKITIQWKSVPLDAEFESTLGVDTLSKQETLSNISYLFSQILPIGAKYALLKPDAMVEALKLAVDAAGLDPNIFITDTTPQTLTEANQTGEQGVPSPTSAVGLEPPVTQNIFKGTL